MKQARWQDFERLVEDMDAIIEGPGWVNDHVALVCARALTYIYWQRQCIEEVKCDLATIHSQVQAIQNNR
jgi:hypothetical protein